MERIELCNGEAMRKSTIYLLVTALASLVLLLMIGIHSIAARQETAQRLLAGRQLVEHMELTDICLYTEAPHTRHPNMADRFVPFQDHPAATPHFPSESFVMPPHHLTHPRPATPKGGTP